MRRTSSDKGAIERVVIYRLGSLGDTIVALPCFHKVAQLFPDAERIVLTNFPVAALAAPLEDILGQGKLVSRYISYTAASRSVWELLVLRRRLKATGAETLVYLASSRGLFSAWRDLLFFKLCGFTRIVGIPLRRDLQENRIDASTGLVEPECERLARTLADLGPIDLRDVAMWDLLLTADELTVGEKFRLQFEDRPFIAIHVGGKAVEKDWGEQNWRMLLQDISASHGEHGLLLLGADEDMGRYRAIVSGWRGPVVSACGKLTPRQCAATLRFARLFVGHDSGPLHLASISNVPCVGLFGSFNLPRKWHPYVGAHHIIHRSEGISKISVDEVAGAIRGLFSETRARASSRSPSGRLAG